MCERGSGLHRNRMRIEWAQAHCMRKMINRHVRLAEPDTDPPAGIPSPRQIWIEQESPVNEGGGGIQVANDKCEGVSTPRERDCIILAQFRRLPCKTRSFCDFSNAVHHPAIDLAPAVAPSGHAVGRGEIWVEFNGLVEQWQRLVDRLLRSQIVA